MTREADGEAVVVAALIGAREVFTNELSAAYVLGSLAHGGFAPLVSDVDVLLVLRNIDSSTASRAAGVREKVRREIASDLAGRLSLFWSDSAGVQNGVGSYGRLPEVDRMDLLEAGRLVLGQDCRRGATPPAIDDLVRAAATFSLTSFDDTYRSRLRDPDLLIRSGVRSVTKAALFPVRFLYTLATGRTGCIDHAVEWCAGHGHHAELVTAAGRWRLSGLPGSHAVHDLVRLHLRPIYLSFVEEYASALHGMGDDRLAARLVEWGQQLR